jgi:hypothetical protein
MPALSAARRPGAWAAALKVANAVPDNGERLAALAKAEAMRFADEEPAIPFFCVGPAVTRVARGEWLHREPAGGQPEPLPFPRAPVAVRLGLP